MYDKQIQIYFMEIQIYLMEIQKYNTSSLFHFIHRER